MKLTNTCGNCGHAYTLSQTSTQLHVFTKYPGMSYLDAACPMATCDAEEMLFFVFMGQKLSAVKALGWHKVVTKDAPDTGQLMKYYQATDTGPASFHALLPRHEAEIEKLAKVLTDTPADLLFDALTAPALRPVLPRRWAD